jgi:hypothetical protein
MNSLTLASLSYLVVSGCKDTTPFYFHKLFLTLFLNYNNPNLIQT